MRKDWNLIWMDLAHSIAQRSTDEKHQVGCVIISGDNQRVLAIGYNGDHKGGSNTRISQEHGKSGFIHAETNALIKLNTGEVCEKIMFLTLSPCYSCAQLIINAGINKVYYTTQYSDLEAIKLLKTFNIEIEQIR